MTNQATIDKLIEMRLTTMADAWITDPLAVVMIKDIDRSEVMGMYPIERMASYLQAIVNVMEGVENSATGGDATVWQGR